MGISFSEPVSVKRTQRVSDAKFFCGSSTMQGWRMKMEDAHTHMLRVKDFPGLSYFALFDGHGGADVANFANKGLIKNILNEIIKNKEITGHENFPAALKNAFINLDKEISDLGQEMTGSTANVFIMVENDIYCANIGDSRLVISVGGMALDMSEDHKPSNEAELRRIVEAKGWVQNYRVNGSLALSRAFGDFFYKRNRHIPPDKQTVIAVPDITKTTITADYEFFVQACDGIWDVMTSQEVINFVRLRIANGMATDVICEELMTNCLAPDLHMAGLGCDNMTVIVGIFLKGMTLDTHRITCKSFVPFQFKTVPEEATKIEVLFKEPTRAKIPNPLELDGTFTNNNDVDDVEGKKYDFDDDDDGFVGNGNVASNEVDDCESDVRRYDDDDEVIDSNKHFVINV